MIKLYDLAKGLKLDMAFLETMGGRIKLARLDQRLNQLELLEKLKERGHEITPAHWSRVENNERGISLNLLIAAADILEQSLDHLTGRPEYTKEVIEQFSTSEANEVAKLLDKMDEDMRRFVLMCAYHVKDLDAERKALHKEIAALLMESLDSTMTGDAKIRARSILNKINVK